MGRKFAQDQIGPMRDEVLLEFVKKENELILFGFVLVSSEKMNRNAKLRNEIFLREMPTALQAIRIADEKFYDRHPCMNLVPIRIWFQSDEEEYNQTYDFGIMQDYRSMI